MATSGSFLTSGYTGSKDTIYLRFSWELTSQSITGNTSTISWTLAGERETTGYVKAGGFKVVIDGDTEYSVPTSTRISLYNGTIIASGTKTITHNEDGSRSFTVYAEGGIFTYDVNCTGEKTFTLDTIARASALNISDGVLGESHTLTVSKQSAGYTHTIEYTCGSETATICTKSGEESIAFVLPLTLASYQTTGTKVAVVFSLQTYSGNTAIGAAVQKTAYFTIPESVKPTCTISVSDVMGYADRYGKYVKGLSRLSVAVDAQPAYGADIAAYRVTVDGNTYAAETFTTDALKSSGDVQIAATVTDARGRASEETMHSIAVMDYASPTITALSVHRCDADGNEDMQGGYARVVFSAIVSPLENQNTATYVLNYKKTSEADWSGIALDALTDNYAVTEHAQIVAIDTGSAYDIQITVEDNHRGSTRGSSVSTSFALMHFNANGTGIAFGRISSKENALEVGVDAYFDKNINAGEDVYGHNFYVNGEVFDKHAMRITNGMAVYQSAAQGVIDPNETLEELILTNHANGPAEGTFFYIETRFYSSKSVTSNREQTAWPYKANGSMYHRVYESGTWSQWRRNVNADESPLALEPIPNANSLKGYNNAGTSCTLIGIDSSNAILIGDRSANILQDAVIASKDDPLHYDGSKYYNIITAKGGKSINGSLGVRGGSLVWDAQGVDNCALAFGSSVENTSKPSGRVYLGTDTSNVSIATSTLTVTAQNDGTSKSQIFMPKLPAGSGTTIAMIDARYGTIGKVSSARKYKENIEPIGETEADIIDEFEPVTFNYIGQEGVRTYGVIADDVEKFAPDLCYYEEKLDENGEPTGEKEIESVSYQGIQMLMLKEIQRLRRRVAALEEAQKNVE